MKVIRQLFKDVLTIEPNNQADERGNICKVYSEDLMDSVKIDGVFVEEDLYDAKKMSTVYGIYYQDEPYAQNKLISIISGSIMVYAIEFDPKNPKYLEWICIELDSASHKMAYIPSHYAYLILTLEDNTKFCVKRDEYNTEGYLRVITYLDKTINLEFPFDDVISIYKEKTAPSL